VSSHRHPSFTFQPPLACSQSNTVSPATYRHIIILTWCKRSFLFCLFLSGQVCRLPHRPIRFNKPELCFSASGSTIYFIHNKLQINSQKHIQIREVLNRQQHASHMPKLWLYVHMKLLKHIDWTFNDHKLIDCTCKKNKINYYTTDLEVEWFKQTHQHADDLCILAHTSVHQNTRRKASQRVNCRCWRILA
jgi:hypothetical protein